MWNMEIKQHWSGLPGDWFIYVFPYFDVGSAGFTFIL